MNGHNVSSGDWFVLNQTQTVGRSVSYTLLPSEVVGTVIVHKSSEASLVEGGVAGSVDIITRKPLEFSKSFTAEASVGAVYATLPKKGDGQYSGLVNWKNEAGTFGILVQGFSETRHLRRDGVEELGYEQVSPTSTLALAHPDTANAYYPTDIGSALFEQVRKRTGGLVDIELKPNDDTTLDFNAFDSKLQASNTNRNYMLWLTHVLAQGNGQQPTSYAVTGNTLTSATFANDGTLHGIYDQISRPGEEADSKYFDFDGKFRLSDKLLVKTQIGTTNGAGKTPTQDVMELQTGNNGAFYQLNGVNSGASFGFPGGTNTAPTAATTLNWIFGDDAVNNTDKEHWAQIDSEYAIEAGPLVNLKFGARATDHSRQQLGTINQGPLPGVAGTSPVGGSAVDYPSVSGQYPSNFGSGLGGSFPTDAYTYSPAQLAAFDAAYANRAATGPNNRHDWTQDFALREKDTAVYIQGDLEGEHWSGNVGLRLVNTTEHVETFQAATATTPGADTSSAFGAYVPLITNHSYNDPLPSANFKYNLTKDMVLRVAASRTMTRADYSALAGTVSLGQVTGTTGGGSGGNPDLKPVTSNNLDLSWEYYFAPQAALTVSAFYMDLTSDISYGHTNKTYLTFDATHPNGYNVDYTLTTPINSSGKVKGLEVAYEQSLFGNFGVSANGTYTDAKEDDGSAMVGASKTTWNLGGYFENDLFNVRVAYNHRSSFYSGLDRSTAFYQAGGGDLSATAGVTITKWMSVTLDGRNLEQPEAEVLRAEHRPAALDLHERPSVLPDRALQVLITRVS